MSSRRRLHWFFSLSLTLQGMFKIFIFFFLFSFSFWSLREEYMDLDEKNGWTTLVAGNYDQAQFGADPRSAEFMVKQLLVVWNYIFIIGLGSIELKGTVRPQRRMLNSDLMFALEDKSVTNVIELSFLGHRRLYSEVTFAFMLTCMWADNVADFNCSRVKKKKSSCFDLVNGLQLFLLAASAF